MRKLILLFLFVTAAAYGANIWNSTTFKSSVVFDSLTATTVPYLSASKVLTSSAVTPTELGYVSGVTSAIQTQINALSTAAVSPTDIINCSISTSVGSNALTIALKDSSGSDPSGGSVCKVAFRNTTAATGTYSAVSTSAATSVVVSSGSTLGTTSGAAAMLYVYAINNSGTVELGVINGLLLDESAVQTSTAEGGAGGADTIGTFYSTTARASKAIRLIGSIAITEATAGTWASNATTVYSYPITPKKNITIQSFTSGSGTYTTPAGVKWIKVRMIGGGGAGAGGGTSTATSGNAGNDTTFGSFTAGGGEGGQADGGEAADGGTCTFAGTGISVAGMPGGSGYWGAPAGGINSQTAGGHGGNGVFGGGGRSANVGSGTPTAGATNSGSGGGGGGSGSSGGLAVYAGGGGGAGCYIEAYITNPAATYSYGVGAAQTTNGTGGTAGSDGQDGAAGFIIVEEYY